MTTINSLNQQKLINRRSSIKTILAAGSAGLFAAGGSAAYAASKQKSQTQQKPETRNNNLNNRIKHSVCRWCYSKIPLDKLCKNAADMGYKSVELLNENQWSIPRKFGLTCAVANGPNPINKGWNRIENHDEFVKESERLLPLIKAANIPNMIVFSGNRAGLPDSEGIKNCVKGLKRIIPIAENLGVNIIMELLNSRVSHKDYQCDRTPWGVEVVKGIASDRFKLLYDIYHMQIMEGDIIRTICDNIKYIGHFHTGGVPGRREIDDTQELNYPAICEAIVKTGYKGFLGQEFIPRNDPMTSLANAIKTCDV